MALLGETETLGSSAEERETRRWPAALAAAVAIVLALAWFADSRMAAGERDALATAVRGGGESVSRAEGRIVGMVDYGGPLLSSATVDPQVRSTLLSLVRGAAAEGAVDLRAARDAVADVRIAPWRPDLLTARDAYAAYLADRLSQLDVAAERYPASLPSGGGGSEQRAREALLAAFPGGPAEVDAMLAPGAGGS